jgi:hypothetical protein
MNTNMTLFGRALALWQGCSFSINSNARKSHIFMASNFKPKQLRLRHFLLCFGFKAVFKCECLTKLPKRTEAIGEASLKALPKMPYAIT